MRYELLALSLLGSCSGLVVTTGPAVPIVSHSLSAPVAGQTASGHFARDEQALIFPMEAIAGSEQLTDEELAARDEARLKAIPVLAFGLLPSLWAAQSKGMPGAFDKDKTKK